LKNLALSSLILLFLSSCSLALFNDFQPYPGAAESKKDACSWFREDTGRYLFQSSVDVFSNHFTGLLFVKPLQGRSHRIIFITEVGIKIFDMEFFNDGEFKLHYCLEELNRKAIIKTLSNDLALMVDNIASNGKVKMMKDKKTDRMIIKSKDYNGTRYCIVNDKTNKIEELIRTGSLTNKVNIKFFSISGAQPDSINISHYNLKLSIHLSKLNENGSDIP
jgi:hypothetical protein